MHVATTHWVITAHQTYSMEYTTLQKIRNPDAPTTNLGTTALATLSDTSASKTPSETIVTTTTSGKGAPPTSSVMVALKTHLGHFAVITHLVTTV